MIFKKISPFILAVLLAIAGYPQDQDRSYRIGPEDLIEISVFNVPELNKTVRVSEDGSVNLALIGKVMVADQTRFEVEKKLAALLEEKYLKNPQVTVFIKEYKSRSISVIGAVVNPGIYMLFGNKTLLDAVTMAGGLSEKEMGVAVIIRKYPDGTSDSIQVDLNKLMLGQDPRLNVPLKAGDIVNIPIKKLLNIYVFGQVENPGEVRLESEGSASLLQAIAAAGGFTSRARKQAVLVKRVVDGKEKTFKINVRSILQGRQKDFQLLDNDVVHVSESIL